MLQVVTRRSRQGGAAIWNMRLPRAPWHLSPRRGAAQMGFSWDRSGGNPNGSPHSTGQNSSHSHSYKHCMLGTIVPNKVGCWEVQSSCELGWQVCDHGLSEHLGWGNRGGPEALPHEAQVRELSTLILEKETQVCLHPCSWKSETNGLCT